MQRTSFKFEEHYCLKFFIAGVDIYGVDVFLCFATQSSCGVLRISAAWLNISKISN